MYSRSENGQKPTYMVIQTASPDESSHFSSSLHMPEYTSQGLVELLRSVAKFSIVTITFYQCYIKEL